MYPGPFFWHRLEVSQTNISEAPHRLGMCSLLPSFALPPTVSTSLRIFAHTQGSLFTPPTSVLPFKCWIQHSFIREAFPDSPRLRGTPVISPSHVTLCLSLLYLLHTIITWWPVHCPLWTVSSTEMQLSPYYVPMPSLSSCRSSNNIFLVKTFLSFRLSKDYLDFWGQISLIK